MEAVGGGRESWGKTDGDRGRGEGRLEGGGMVAGC